LDLPLFPWRTLVQLAGKAEILKAEKLKSEVLKGALVALGFGFGAVVAGVEAGVVGGAVDFDPVGAVDATWLRHDGADRENAGDLPSTKATARLIVGSVVMG
jgi:hypothetical protein